MGFEFILELALEKSLFKRIQKSKYSQTNSLRCKSFHNLKENIQLNKNNISLRCQN